MPEGLEAEIYRRAADAVVRAEVGAVDVDAHQVMAPELGRQLPGRLIVGTRRRGKHVLLDLDDGGVLGLHFGMTGRLVVAGAAPIEELVYSSGRDDPAWDRLVLRFTDGRVLRVNDPRRWATFTLDPDLARLGPDFLELTGEVLAARLARRRAAVKTVLLDQSVVAGFGNLCVDEVLWQARIDPATSVADLDLGRLDGLARAATDTLPSMLDRGGSHTGVLDPETRASCPPCPRCGTPLRRTTLGGRTTVWCPNDQRG